ncbi:MULTISPECIES: hypothetical protein [unclassified Pseudomonas]|uniref:hypothetical protein n=1 Tax=unclassified Pseudomonas TaxID=196821 RepID=UPI000837CFD6|nr:MULTISPECIES: hypothetical protein [unclassified Pseudomonas]QIH06416.1 hypothetical protein ATY02_06730 [Pseudomonas sp. BIOMIG1BAC]
MERTLTDAEIRDILARERRNLRGSQAMVYFILGLFAAIALLGVGLFIHTLLAWALAVPLAVFLWWWIYYRTRAMENTVGTHTLWLQAQFSATWVNAHRNGHWRYVFGDYPIAASNLIDNLFSAGKLNIHAQYRVEAVLLTCPQTSSHCYHLFPDTFIEISGDQQPASEDGYSIPT